MDTVGKTVYILTEKHRYREVLSLLKKIEPKTAPIKDVTVEKKGLMATGYKVPSTTLMKESVKKVIEDAEPLS